MSELPSGTVTFLFTDIEGSTRLWEEHPDAMRAALTRHDELIATAVAANSGHVVKTTGDGFHAVFASAHDAVAAAVAAQREIEGEPWSDPVRVRARMGVHTGEAHRRAGDYYGSSTNRAARFMSAGHGGQIVVSAVTAALVSEHLPADFELLALGEHRLRDLAEPVAVFQLAAPGLQREFPTLRSLDAYLSNLPAQLSSFVGRERDVLEIAKLLREKRLVTLTGVGGVGKTRLALQVAADVLPRFRDGAWFCELASVRDPAGVVDSVANVFQVTARPGLSLEGSLVAYLRNLEVLVVLDNCEHVLRPVAALITAVEAACPAVRVLATSREGLGVRGEQNLTVPSLDVPDDVMDVDALGACAAVRLFVDRAQGAKANFVVDAANAEGVARVCRRLDGVPLAIELAAARVPAMNPAELAQRLDRRFRLLTGGERVAIERHRTLRATIDWSYDLLTEPEQRLLDRLAVFSGGCTLEAAEAVCSEDPIGADDVLELTANLVARSLVVADDTGPDTRYRLLETIRQYGEERLADAGAGDTDRLRARHCDYYAEFAGVVRTHSYGPGQVEWGARLARDHDNLLAAMAFALETEDLERAVRLFCRLPFRGLQINDVVIFDPDPVLALAGAADHPGSAIVLMLSSFQALWQGDGALALELCDHALAAEGRLGPTPDSHLAMTSCLLRALVAVDAGAQRAAADHYLDASRHARADDLPAMTATFLGNAANLLAWLEPSAALPLATEALALARDAGAPYAIANSLVALVQALAPDDPHRAEGLLEEVIQLAVTLGYESPVQLNSVAFTAARLDDWPTSLRAASRVFHHLLRSGAGSPVIFAGCLNFAARGLAPHRPEPAAVIQGTVSVALSRLHPSTEARGAATSAEPNTVATFITGVRHDTTQLLVAALGEARMRELRAQGTAMNEDQICSYARRHIDEYLATTDEPPND